MCQVNFNFDCKLGFGLQFKHFIFVILCLAVSAATVFLGGLASLQNECHDSGIDFNENTNHLAGLRGFSASALSCKKIFRFYWFIVAFEFVVGAIGLYVVSAEGKLPMLKSAVQGLFVIATLLFIYTSDAFLGLLENHLFQSETLHDRSKTAIAGAIMTATLNSFIVFLTGLAC